MIGFAGRRLSTWLLVLKRAPYCDQKKRQPGLGASHGCRRSKVAPASFQKPADRNHNRGPKTERKQTCERPRHKKLHGGELRTNYVYQISRLYVKGDFHLQLGAIGDPQRSLTLTQLIQSRSDVANE